MLYTDTVQKIKVLSSEQKKTESDVVDEAVREFYKEKDVEYQKYIKELSNLLDEKLNEMKEVLNKVHLAVNVINKETKMNLEFWNHHHFVNEYDLIVTTEDARSKALDTIESVVNKNIEKERIKKLDRKN